VVQIRDKTFWPFYTVSNFKNTQTHLKSHFPDKSGLAGAPCFFPLAVPKQYLGNTWCTFL